MDKKILIRIYAWALIISCCSCNSWLDVELINKTDEVRLFSTETGFREALAGIYSKISAPELYGREMTFGTLDVMAQIYSYAKMDKAWWDYRDYKYDVDDVKGRFYAFWLNEYTAIASTNNLLEWLDRNGSVMKEDTRKQIRGEALALRAYLHFDLLRLFAPDVKKDPEARKVPYNKKFGVEAPAVCTSSEFVGFVIEDLNEALVMLEKDPIRTVIPYEFGNAGKDSDDGANKNKNGADQYVARMNYYAVEALLARVYLVAGNMEKAAEMAMDVINSEKFRLVQKEISIEVPEANLDVLFSDEHIFSLRNKNIRTYSNDLHRKTALVYQYLPMADYYKSIYDYPSDDVRALYWLPDNALEKFTKKNDERFYPKIPLLRLGEMYLIAAEAYMNLNNKKDAIPLLNAFRASRISGSIDRAFISLREITDEYRRDFVGEGQLFFMYKRLNLDIRRETSPWDVPADDKVFVLPIPDREIQYGNVVE